MGICSLLNCLRILVRSFSIYVAVGGSGDDGMESSANYLIDKMAEDEITIIPLS